MGPRSSDRGYAYISINDSVTFLTLQWVHGPQTVVMCTHTNSFNTRFKLQWVHGPQTVVMLL